MTSAGCGCWSQSRDSGCIAPPADGFVAGENALHDDIVPKFTSRKWARAAESLIRASPGAIRPTFAFRRVGQGGGNLDLDGPTR